MKKRWIPVIALFILGIILYSIGYRFTPESAAKAYSQLGNKATLIHKIQNTHGTVYVFQVNAYYMSIMPTPTLFLWRSASAISTESLNDKSDTLRLIGSSNAIYSDSFELDLLFTVNDEKVAYISFSNPDGRQNQNVDKSRLCLLQLKTKKMWTLQALSPTACDANGKELYKYGYDPSTPNTLKNSELRWRAIK